MSFSGDWQRRKRDGMIVMGQVSSGTGHQRESMASTSFRNRKFQRFESGAELPEIEPPALHVSARIAGRLPGSRSVWFLLTAAEIGWVSRMRGGQEENAEDIKEAGH
jgi:hypothetical protein